MLIQTINKFLLVYHRVQFLGNIADTNTPEQCWPNDGPPSTTQDQRQTTTNPGNRVPWDACSKTHNKVSYYYQNPSLLHI